MFNVRVKSNDLRWTIIMQKPIVTILVVSRDCERGSRLHKLPMFKSYINPRSPTTDESNVRVIKGRSGFSRHEYSEGYHLEVIQKLK